MVEPHLLAACFLKSILKSSVAREFSLDGETPLARKKTNKSAVVLIDCETIRSPLSKYLRILRGKVPNAKVLLIGRSLPGDEICRLLFLGIHGYVAYEEVSERLQSAIVAVRAGSFWVPREILENFVRYSAKLNQSRAAGQLGLTKREEMVVELLQREMSNKEIASALGISERTAKFHLSNIFAKRGVHDRHSMVMIAKSEQSSKAHVH